MRPEGAFPKVDSGFPAAPLHVDAENAELIRVPGDLPLTADYVRSGPDLILAGADGESLLLAGFFAGDAPPDLVTPAGAVIDGNLAARLAGPLAPAQFAQAGGAAASPIGTVSTAVGPVTIRHPDGTTVDAVKGAAILEGDVVETGKGGKVALTFADKTTFSLGESGRMTIDEMVYDPTAHSGAKLAVVQGVFSFVSGQIAKTGPDAMMVKTPVATIGIRGTSVAGKGAAEGATNNFTLLKDPDGTVGQIAVSNSAGVQILSQPFQTTSVVSAYAPPSALVVLSPTVVGQFYGAVTDILPTPPIRDDRPAPERGPDEGRAPEEGRAAEAEEQTAAAREAAEAGAEAGEQAFEQALAQGKSMEEAMVAAAKAAIEGVAGKMAELVPEAMKAPEVASLVQMMKGDATIFDLVQAGRDMGGVVTGPPVGMGPEMAMFGPGPQGPFVGDVGIMGIYNMEFGPLGFIPPPVFAVIQEAFVSVVTEAYISEGTISVFDEVLAGTLGNDTILGGAGSTRVTMAQGSTLGGTDSVNGGGGIDELTLTNLNDFFGLWNLHDNYIMYEIADTFAGSIDIENVEQIYASDGTESRVRLALDPGVSGFGYILAGTTAADTLTLANGTAYTGVSHTIADASVYGAIIFGGLGNDSITGSAAQDIIYGGAGNDIINANGTDGDPEAVYCGIGDDTLVIAQPGDILSGGIPIGSFIGELGTDTVQVGKAGTATGQTFKLDASQSAIAFASFEKMHVYAANTVVEGDDLSFFQQLTHVTTEGAASGITIKSVDYSLTLSSAQVDANVATLRATDYDRDHDSVNDGVVIHDGADANGRTLWGSDSADRLYGYGGGDTFQLGLVNTPTTADSAVDHIYYTATNEGAAAGANTGFDAIKSMGATDVIFLCSTGFAAFDDIADNDTLSKASVTATASVHDAIDLSAATGTEMVFVNSDLLDSQLTEAGFATLVARLGSVTAGTATGSDAQNDAILAVRADGGNGHTGIYLYTNGDGASAGNTTIDADELTLLAVVEDLALGEAQVMMSA